MLKNKKTVYLLIPINLLIWGFFIYRFWSAYADTDLPLNSPKLKALKMDDVKDSAAYILKSDYKDPFLKEGERAFRITGTENNEPSAPVQRQATAVKPPAPLPKKLPDIRYIGLIKNSSSGTATALVSLNGQSALIRQNETLDGITFKSFNKDSLVAKWGKEKIVVRK